MKKDQINIDQKLLVLYLLNEISQQGRAQVEVWLNASDENRLYFEGFRKTWEATGKIDPSSVAFDANKAWGKMSARIQEGEKGATMVQNLKNIQARMGRMRFYIAAAAVVVFMVASVWYIRVLQSKQMGEIVTLASYSVPVQDTLTDGSTVVLNADTKLMVPKNFEKSLRKVELRGEAFFQVEHDAARPFIIDAGLGQVTVLGTSFHVKAYAGSDLEVYVESGRVELAATDSLTGDTTKIVLKAGDRAMIRKGTHEISKPAEIGADELFWANKKLIFQETKLSLVFDLLKKHYEAAIEVQDTTILNCLLSATFTDESIDQILEVVATSFNLKMSRDDKKFIIKGKGCTDEEK